MDVGITTSLVIPESADNAENVTAGTQMSGLFVKPSQVLGRPTNIENYVLTSENEYGKAVYEGQDFDISLEPRVDILQTGSITQGVTAHGRRGQITTVPTMSINTGDQVEFVVTNMYASTDSIILVFPQIDSFADHLFVNAVNVGDGSFTLRLSNYYNVTYTGPEIAINYALF